MTAARVVVEPAELTQLASACRQDGADVRSLAVALGIDAIGTSPSLLIAYGIHIVDLLGRLAAVTSGPDGMLDLARHLCDDGDRVDEVRQSFEAADTPDPSAAPPLVGDGRGDPDGRGGRREANDQRTRTPEGGRSDPPGGQHLANDWAGRAILERYLTGGDDWTIIDDPRWTSYLTQNSELVEDVRPHVEAAARQALDAFRASGQPDGAVDERFEVVIQNGEGMVGYQYLHGTNADVGGFGLRGDTHVLHRPDGSYQVRVVAEYTWNDIIDPNEQYPTDQWKSKLAEAATLGKADPYTFRCTWTKESVLEFDADGNFVGATGFPFA